MTQCERLLSRLRIGPVNPMQAWNELGIYRLGARVFDLKGKHGHKIVTEEVTVLNRYGEKCRVAQYRLEETVSEAA